MASRPKILIVALSGRALAAAARRAGWRPLVADLFGDQDTRRTAQACEVVAGDIDDGFDGDDLIRVADRLSPGDAAPLAVGAGFEDRPALLTRLARGRRLLGNPPDVLARIKDPELFFPCLDALGIPHPAVTFAPPPRLDGWLTKRRGASGGGHIRTARAEAPSNPDDYFQRRAPGRPVSALFLGAARRARVLGFSEQWRASETDQDFRFGGLAGPTELPPETEAALAQAVRDLVAAFGLRGLNSADFLVRDRDFDLLEVNPRPGASLDVFEGEPGLFDLHCRACAGRLPERWTGPAGAKALSILYAPEDLAVPGDFAWPEGTANRPAPGTRIRRGHPICTVIARAATVDRARRRVAVRAGRLLASLQAHAVEPMRA